MRLKATKRQRGRKAVSPAISSVIVTGAMVTLITVALTFASNFLVFRVAESEFGSAERFMQTLGLQIDDVAWVIERTETARYSSMYGDVEFEPALNYTVYVSTDEGVNKTYQIFYSNITGIICFNMPVSHYSVVDGYFELIHPSSHNGFLCGGASAPATRTFAIERLPMADGNFVRIVVMPAIRMLNLSIGDTTYLRLYLPILLEGETPRLSQSVTLTGESVSKFAASVTGVKIEVGFPLAEFDNFFFNLPETVESISTEGMSNLVLELYVGGVDVALGAHL